MPSSPPGVSTHNPHHMPQQTGSALDDLAFDLNVDPETAVKIRELAKAKEEAVAAEVFRPEMPTA